MMRITLQQLLSATKGTCPAAPAGPLAFMRIELDSRKIQPGDLFWAVRGERHDGHEFVGQALENGAAACVVQKDKAAALATHLEANPARHILVDDTLQALWNLARSRREARPARVIGVTGSVGKTTTRGMIHTVLSARFAGTQSPKNFNNHFGVPLSLFEIGPDDDFAVLELGASRVGEIRELAGIAQPDIGVVTAVAPAHVEGFGNLDNIEAAKGELVESLPPGGLAVLAGDDVRVRRMQLRARCRVLLVGETHGNHIRAKDARAGLESLAFRVDHEEYHVPATGRHFLTAALAAVAVARDFGMTPDDIRQGFEHFQPAEGRCVLRTLGGITVIDDTYNANPGSMSAACRLLAEWPEAGRKIAVLGDMKELGDEAPAHHRHIGHLAAKLGIDLVIAHGDHANDVVVGANAARTSTHSTSHDTFDGLLDQLEHTVHPGDIVLVKGSRSMRMERAVAWLDEHARKWARLPNCLKEFEVRHRQSVAQR